MHRVERASAPRWCPHSFANSRPAPGRVRRLDVILAPAEEAAFCVLGWSGSRQWLRFLRQYAADLGMHLNSHRCGSLPADSLAPCRLVRVVKRMPPGDAEHEHVTEMCWCQGVGILCALPMILKDQPLYCAFMAHVTSAATSICNHGANPITV